MSEKKKRLDIKLVECGIAQSRERAKSLIMAGKITETIKLRTSPAYWFLKMMPSLLREKRCPSSAGVGS
ncbi:MAG: hypothetical protein KKE00_10575, partial [Proteobacteria bacterium]|nr:hypothetical protein [Pseudomonadota bacterium]MBU1570945.1 hypothetical protein [Pseudomonadota bacterium]